MKLQAGKDLFSGCPFALPASSGGAVGERACELPAVVLLGGGANALSVARSLGRVGVKVYALNDAGAHVCYSRYCEWIPLPNSADAEKVWADYLLGPDSQPLHGSVVLACSDPGIVLLLKHRDELARHYRLDDANPDAQRCMLNKLSTYQAAVAAGVPTPRFWVAHGRGELLHLAGERVYPLIVKPLLSHVFEQRFGKKFLVANDYGELEAGLETAAEAGVEVMVVEKIVGPDDRSCSYYTYLDENSEPLFHFTKRNLRRSPKNMGGSCYHITDWNPEVAELALRLLRHTRLRGLAHVEFKRDERDGQLKLIECNARFTAANPLLVASGLDLGLLVYNRLVGRPQEPLKSYALGMRLWEPVKDFYAFRELHRLGELSWLGWLRSVLHRQHLTFWSWRDPLPTLACGSQGVRDWVRRRLTRRGSSRSSATAPSGPLLPPARGSA